MGRGRARRHVGWRRRPLRRRPGRRTRGHRGRRRAPRRRDAESRAGPCLPAKALRLGGATAAGPGRRREARAEARAPATATAADDVRFDADMNDATTARSRVFFCRDPRLLEPPEKASRDACGAAWMRVRKPASGERRGTRGGSVDAPAHRGHTWLPSRPLDARARRTRAPPRAPRVAPFRAARCAFSTVSRVARSRGGAACRAETQQSVGART